MERLLAALLGVVAGTIVGLGYIKIVEFIFGQGMITAVIILISLIIIILCVAFL